MTSGEYLIEGGESQHKNKGEGTMKIRVSDIVLISSGFVFGFVIIHLIIEHTISPLSIVLGSIALIAMGFILIRDYRRERQDTNDKIS